MTIETDLSGAELDARTALARAKDDVAKVETEAATIEADADKKVSWLPGNVTIWEASLVALMVTVVFFYIVAHL